MSPKAFLENFGHLANAPGGVARARELVLSFAFKGQLSKRQGSDELISDQYAENQKDRKGRIHKGNLRQQKHLSGIDEDETPWSIPKHWKWCRLGEVTSYGSSDKAEFNDIDENVWVLELEDIEKDTSTLIKRVRAKERRFKSFKNRFFEHQVLYGKLRPYLDKVLVADEDGVCTTEIIPIAPFEGIDSNYLRWFLKSPWFREYANSSTHGMNLPRLGTEPARSAFFPFAPLAEQRRIVAKVDALMALCNRLETQQRERAELRPRLAKATNSRFIENPTPETLRACFADPGHANPKELRKTILSLAVQGKLVEQDEGDEHVELTLKVGRKAKMLDRAGPTGWHYRYYRDLTSLVTSGSRGWKQYYSKHGAVFVRTQNIKTDSFNIDDVAFVDLPDPLEGKRARIQKDDILITITGANVTKVARVESDPPEAYISQHIALSRPKLAEMSPWLHLCFISPAAARGQLEKLVYGDKPGLNLDNIRNLEIPVPPLAEQRRIVAKVDALMALVDKLEQQQTYRDELAASYAQSAVSALTGTEFKPKPEKMKAPKTELIAMVRLRANPDDKAAAPLASLLSTSNDELEAKTLWQRSGLAIEDFYQHLKREIAAGYIQQPEVPAFWRVEDSKSGTNRTRIH